MVKFNCSQNRVAHVKRLSGWIYGPIAQLGERHNGIVEVKGSSPFGSTLASRNSWMLAVNQSGTAEPLSSLNERGFYFLRGLPDLSDWQVLV